MKTKAQVTLFIILAVVIVGSLVTVFFITSKSSTLEAETPETLGPRGFIQKCVSDVVEDSADKIIESGLITEPIITTMYKGREIPYVCYQQNNYETCYNLYPMLEDKLEAKITEDIKEDIQNCFNILLENFENKGYDVTGEGTIYSVDILPGEIDVSISKPITISRDDFGESFENFDTKTISPLYEFIRISRTIVNSESNYCYFEYNGYTILYPRYRIHVTTMNDDSKIYSIYDTKTTKEFEIATRSCGLPSGLY